MSEQVSKKVRQQVASRANFRCEYCRIKEKDSFLSFQIDHIVSKKHGGGDEVENLAYACPHCNQNKGRSYHFHWLIRKYPSHFSSKKRKLIFSFCSKGRCHRGSDRKRRSHH